MTSSFKLYGRMFVTGRIGVKTGLHIGASESLFSIGKTDKMVIANPITGQPYIPGSSLRGKMRSLTEKYEGKVTGQRIAQGEIHSCKTLEDYRACSICNLYGRSAEDFNWPTRLIVRDVTLWPDSAEQLRRARTELPYTETKTEVSIDRVTSQANPRTIERVPAGAEFGPFELVLSFFDAGDVNWIATLVDGMALLEDDYLGGHGSRGSGKIVFRHLEVRFKAGSGAYRTTTAGQELKFENLEEFSAALDTVMERAQQLMFGSSL